MSGRVCPNVSSEVEGAARKLARDGFHLSAIHQYTHPDGLPWWWVVRMESTSTPKLPKRIFPMRRTEAGFEFKRPDFGVSGSPLYNLHVLKRYPNDVVYLVEGEKAADCLIRLGLIATTWPNGAAAIGKADLDPLAGRDLVAWPDNDEPGLKAMLEAQARLDKLCALTLVLDVEGLGLPPKGDAVDWLERFVRERSAVEICAISGGLDAALCEVQDLPYRKIREKV